MSSELSDGTALQQYCLLAKSAKGKGCVAIIEQALNAPGVFVFGELIDMPNVQALEGTEHKPYLDLLRLFAYGTYPLYKANSQSLPSLTPQMLIKLKQLTVVSLSADHKLIPYSVLLHHLDISSVRELEDLLIECIYQGVVRGKLDQKHNQLEVDFAIGRDIRPGQVDQMMGILANWVHRSEVLLAAIMERVNYANTIHEQNRKERAEFEQKLDAVKATLKASDAEMLQGPDHYDSIEYTFDERARKSRAKMKGREQPRERERRL
jgi:COP9 signalosome complex subunit 7